LTTLVAANAGRDTHSATAACVGTCALVLLAPFEALRPLMRIPNPSALSGGTETMLMAVTSVEAALLAVFAVWIVALGAARAFPRWRTPLTWPAVVLFCAMTAAAVASPIDRVNSAHMVARLALAGAVYVVAVNGASRTAHLRAVIASAAIASALLGFVVLLDYGDVGSVRELLGSFRAGVAVVGGQVRATGPFQYPTIASMYLEILFALTLPLLLVALEDGKRWRALGIAAVLLLSAQAITWTFTRAGLLTIGSSLAVVSVARYRARGADRGVAAIALLGALIGAQFAGSRSYELLQLRLTTETTGAWYRVSVDAPPQVTMKTGSIIEVPLIVKNAGRSTWDPAAEQPFLFSYHWLLADTDRVVSWEGLRTPFEAPVAPGQTVRLSARVEAPPSPGQYRLMWDVEQRQRLWFSTEPEAPLLVSHATVTGPPVVGFKEAELRPLPLAAVRPGRGLLWGAALRMAAAHPFTGVGPDNFRMVYGEYAGLDQFDRRVHSNNMYLEVLAGGGLLAAAAFAWLCWRAAHLVCRLLARGAGPLCAGVAAAAIAIALHGLFDVFLSFTATYVLIAIALGLVVASAELKAPHADRV
jgi:O-antigen ligase